MNKKSRICIIVGSALCLLLGTEIFYLQERDRVTQTDLIQKRKFIKITTISELNIALKNNFIKIFP